MLFIITENLIFRNHINLKIIAYQLVTIKSLFFVLKAKRSGFFNRTLMLNNVSL